MIRPTEVKPQLCQQCGKCCETHPCALAPEDLPRIAYFLGFTEEALFRSSLVLDYVENLGERKYYVAPARKNDLPGRIVEASWTFVNDPCIFLQDDRCQIERVKPKGGREFYCSLMTNLKRNLIGYGKNKAAEEWGHVNLLERLITMARTGGNSKPAE